MSSTTVFLDYFFKSKVGTILYKGHNTSYGSYTMDVQKKMTPSSWTEKNQPFKLSDMYTQPYGIAQCPCGIFNMISALFITMNTNLC